MFSIQHFLTTSCVPLSRDVNQKNADKRLSLFESLPIKHKCITAQPLLEKIHIEPYLDDVELVVVGGESDKFARPFDNAAR